MAGQKHEPTVRTIWGLAKCEELRMTGEELHLVVMAQTGNPEADAERNIPCGIRIVPDEGIVTAWQRRTDADV